MADHDEIARREQEWRTLHCAGQQRYRFRFDQRNRNCGWKSKWDSDPYPGFPNVIAARDVCTARATWKVARAPMSVTGVRYYCDAHCPDVAFFGVRPGEAAP